MDRRSGPPGSRRQLAPHLHERTAGRIGSLAGLIRQAAITALVDGTERITKTTLDAIRLDHLAEQHYRPHTRPRSRKSQHPMSRTDVTARAAVAAAPAQRGVLSTEAWLRIPSAAPGVFRVRPLPGDATASCGQLLAETYELALPQLLDGAGITSTATARYPTVELHLSPAACHRIAALARIPLPHLTHAQHHLAPNDDAKPSPSPARSPPCPTSHITAAPAVQATRDSSSAGGHGLLGARSRGPARLHCRLGRQRTPARPCHTGRPARSDQRHGGTGAVAFSSDGSCLAGSSSVYSIDEEIPDEHTVRVWDTATGALLCDPLTGLTCPADTVAFSSQGHVAAGGGWFDTRPGQVLACVWNVAAEQVRGTALTGHQGAVRSMAFSPDGQLLATAGDDRTVRLWDPLSGTHLARLIGHTAAVRSVTFSPDGRLLATADRENTVRLWDLAARALVGPPLEGLQGSLVHLAFSAPDRLLAVISGPQHRGVHVWHRQSGRPASTRTAENG